VISIITVVYNDFLNFQRTEKSIIEQKVFGANIQWVVIDGGSTDGLIQYAIENKSSAIDYFLSENDKGIYDAMNKGKKHAIGYALLYLNAGDYFVGDVLSGVEENDIPCFLPVKYVNYFGKLVNRKIVNKKNGISNCHQGILFPNNINISYDTNFSICADYKYFLDHKYNHKLKILNINTYVYWDQGASLFNWRKRDYEIFLIRKFYFGIFIAIIYEFKPLFKRVLRKYIFKN
jgi:putative colanic acid biosynthesis glycosyltransferase